MSMGTRRSLRDPKGLLQSIYSKCKRLSNDCLIWQGAHSAAGYGNVRVDGRVQAVHKVVYLASYGMTSTDTLVCHSCDVRDCCEPEHLFLGTYSDNTRDAIEKGRVQIVSQEYNLAKRVLTEEQVREIRLDSLGDRSLAKRYGVGRSTIRRIRIGETYKEVV